MGGLSKSKWWLRLATGSWRLGVLGVGCVLGVWALSYFYLLPATDAFADADPSQRRMLRAVSGLMLGVVLLILTLAVGWSIRRRG